jgi:hypothetical protein
VQGFEKYLVSGIALDTSTFTPPTMLFKKTSITSHTMEGYPRGSIAVASKPADVKSDLSILSPACNV